MAKCIDEKPFQGRIYPYMIIKYDHYYEGEVWVVYRGGKFIHKLDGSVSIDEVLNDVRAIDRKEMKGSVERMTDREGRGNKRKNARDIGKME